MLSRGFMLSIRRLPPSRPTLQSVQVVSVSFVRRTPRGSFRTDTMSRSDDDSLDAVDRPSFDLTRPTTINNATHPTSMVIEHGDLRLCRLGVASQALVE